MTDEPRYLIYQRDDDGWYFQYVDDDQPVGPWPSMGIAYARAEREDDE